MVLLSLECKVFRSEGIRCSEDREHGLAGVSRKEIESPPPQASGGTEMVPWARNSAHSSKLSSQICLSFPHQIGLDICLSFYWPLGFPGGLDSRESACNVEDPGSIPWLGRSPGGGHGNPIHSSCLENPMDRGT